MAWTQQASLLLSCDAGFDDPEVMAAVAEVARDPKAIAKYAKNPKVGTHCAQLSAKADIHSAMAPALYQSSGADKGLA